MYEMYKANVHEVNISPSSTAAVKVDYSGSAKRPKRGNKSFSLGKRGEHRRQGKVKDKAKKGIKLSINILVLYTCTEIYT